MMIPSRRKLGAAALIIAGIGAFLVPFLLHSPTTQGTSSNNGGTNPNSGSHTTPPTTTTPTPTTPTSPGANDDKGKDKGSGGGTSDDDSGGSTSGTGTCSADKAKDPSPADNGEGKHNGNAWGVLKNQMDTTVAAVKAMGTHNTAFHLHHDTKTDNDTVKAHHADVDGSNDHDSSCGEKEETDDD